MAGLGQETPPSVPPSLPPSLPPALPACLSPCLSPEIERGREAQRERDRETERWSSVSLSLCPSAPLSLAVAFNHIKNEGLPLSLPLSNTHSDDRP